VGGQTGFSQKKNVEVQDDKITMLQREGRRKRRFPERKEGGLKTQIGKLGRKEKMKWGGEREIIKHKISEEKTNQNSNRGRGDGVLTKTPTTKRHKKNKKKGQTRALSGGENPVKKNRVYCQISQSGFGKRGQKHPKTGAALRKQEGRQGKKRKENKDFIKKLGI